MSVAETASIRAVSISAPGRFEIIERPWPLLEPGMSLARPAFVGLCGTDQELVRGTMAYFGRFC